MSIGDEGAGSLQKPHHFKITSPFSVKAICSAEILPLNSSKSGRRTIKIKNELVGYWMRRIYRELANGEIAGIKAYSRGDRLLHRLLFKGDEGGES